MNYSNTWLIEKYNAGERPKFLFFWGHHPSKDGSVTKSCFSQWWLSPFTVGGILYVSAEHWMMAEKARLFGDDEALERVLLAKTPAEAKKICREVKNFDPVRWDEHKYKSVVEGNLHKFSQHPELLAFLRNTVDRVLVEASPVDRIWGIGMAGDHQDVADPTRWKGENLLGYALMETRDKLQ